MDPLLQPAPDTKTDNKIPMQNSYMAISAYLGGVFMLLLIIFLLQKITA